MYEKEAEKKKILEKKFEMLKLESSAVLKNQRLKFFCSILPQPFVYYKIDTNIKFLQIKFTKNN